MMDLQQTLSAVSAIGAAVGMAAYVWGCVLRPKGDRRYHTTALLLQSLSLAAASALIGRAATGLDSLLLVAFLLPALGCQAVAALRGRRGDRRARAADA